MGAARGARWRWVAVAVFAGSCVLNYLDRQVLAMLLVIWHRDAPFRFTDRDYGLLLSVFSIAYALSAPAMGWFLDRVGLNRGISISVAGWGLASLGSATSHSFGELMLWRCLLGVAEAGGISAMGKMGGMYLPAEERAVGLAMSQLGLSLGAGLAPKFAEVVTREYGWRWVFGGVGALSLLWIPVWLVTARLIPSPMGDGRGGGGASSWKLARDGRLWAMVGANMAGMTVYSLWTNWAPRYLELMHGLSAVAVASYAGWVPLAGYLGSFFGGSLSWRLIRGGVSAVEARKRVCLGSAVLVLGTAAIPLAPGPGWATVGMSVSFFWTAAWSTNLYTMPVDLYGAQRAAFGVSALVFAYGAMQAMVSRPLGGIIERYGFTPVCIVAAVLPLAGQALVASVVRERAGDQA